MYWLLALLLELPTDWRPITEHVQYVSMFLNFFVRNKTTVKVQKLNINLVNKHFFEDFFFQQKYKPDSIWNGMLVKFEKNTVLLPTIARVINN